MKLMTIPLLLELMCSMAPLSLFLYGFFISKYLMARRSVRRKVSSDKAVPTAAPNKQAVTSDDEGHFRLP
jgi:hypothetical protein